MSKPNKLLVFAAGAGFAAATVLNANISLTDDFNDREVGDELIGSTTSGGQWVWTAASEAQPLIAEDGDRTYVDFGSDNHESMGWQSADDGSHLRVDPDGKLVIEFDYLYLTPWDDNNAFNVRYLMEERWLNPLSGGHPDPQGYGLRLRVTGDETLDYDIRQRGGGDWTSVAGTEGTFETSGLLDSDGDTPGRSVRIRLEVEGNHQSLWIDGEHEFTVDIDPLPQNEEFTGGYVQMWTNGSRRRAIDNLSIEGILPERPEPGFAEWVLEDDFENREAGQDLIGTVTSDEQWEWTYHSAVSPVIGEHEGRKFVDFGGEDQLSMTWQSTDNGEYFHLDPEETLVFEYDYLYLTAWDDPNFLNLHYLLDDRWTNMGGASDPTGYSLRLQAAGVNTLEYAVRHRSGGSYSSVPGTEGSVEVPGLINTSDGETPGNPARIRLEVRGNHQSLWIDGEHQFTVDIDPLPQNEEFENAFVQFWSNSARRRGLDNLAIGYVGEDVPAAGFDDWLDGYFTEDQIGDEDVSGPNADPAGDGIPNFLKYALNLDPWESSRSALPAAGWEDGQLSLTYRRLKDAEDVSYIVEVSSDLVDWESGQDYVEVGAVSDEGDVERVEALAVAFPGGADRGFMRLRVVRE